MSKGSALPICLDPSPPDDPGLLFAGGLCLVPRAAPFRLSSGGLSALWLLLPQGLCTAAPYSLIVCASDATSLERPTLISHLMGVTTCHTSHTPSVKNAGLPSKWVNGR